MVFPLFAAFYYWLPLFTGRVPSYRLSRLVFWMIFLGFNITFLPMHATGLFGMTRRSYTYLPEMGWDMLNLVSTVGGFISAAGVGMFIIDFLLHLTHGKRSARNPWNAGTLEWAIEAPVPPYNFASLPVIRDREPLWADPSVAQRSASGQEFLGHTDVRQRETMMTGVLRAEPEHVIVLPGNTWTPFVAALFTALFFASFLAKLYWMAAGGAALAVAALFVWAWQGGSREPDISIQAAEGCRLRLHYASANSPGWWGTLISLLADATVFASLMFSYFYLWTVSPHWPPEGYREIAPWLPALGLAALVGAGISIAWAERGSRLGQSARLQLGFLLAGALGIVYLVLQTLAVFASDMSAKDHAYGALVHTISGYQFVHVGAAILMTLFIVLRSRHGYIGPERPSEVAVASLFWYYTVLQWVLGYAVVHAFPFLV
jgi:cytochrome c oxidase subunit I+III